MKYIQLEPELCNTIREFRSKCKITAAEVSEILGKSSAYCNKIENGKVAKIKEEDFRNLFSAMIQNAGGIINVSFNFFIRRLFSVLYNSVKMTSDLLKASQILPAYFLNIDSILAEFQMQKQQIFAINMFLRDNNISIEDVVTKINLNEDFPDSVKVTDCNWWFSYEEKNLIYLKYSVEDFKKILSGENIKTNYLMIFSFVYNMYCLLKSHSSSPVDIVLTTLNQINVDCVYTHNFFHRVTPPPNSVKKFNTAIFNLRRKLTAIAQTDEKKAEILANKISENIKINNTLALAFMCTDLSAVKNLDLKQQQNFLQDLQEFVNTYQVSNFTQMTLFDVFDDDIDNDDSDD